MLRWIMLYKDLCNEKVSALSFGTMRLPTNDGNDSDIDVTATASMVEYAIKNGVNYFDTAWGYHHGNSERVMGEILSKYSRDSFYIASKFPGYDLSNFEKIEEIFNKQLEKCKVEYFDFYLFHNLCEMNADRYIGNYNGVVDFLVEQKKNGKIKHLGLSVHADTDVLESFLGLYGQHIEFCQIQLNYLDWDFQDAKSKVELLNRLGIPIIVMEPLRGGKLANLSAENLKMLNELRPDETSVSWAFRYLQSVDGVATVLSGMSNMQQLCQNIEIFSDYKPLNEQETKVIYLIASNLLQNTTPCTECRYCVEYCPKGLDIPMLIGLSNEHTFTQGGFLAPMRINSLEEDKRPSACIGCRSCETVCPQNIKISEVLSDFNQKL